MTEEQRTGDRGPSARQVKEIDPKAIGAISESLTTIRNSLIITHNKLEKLSGIEARLTSIEAEMRDEERYSRELEGRLRLVESSTTQNTDFRNMASKLLWLAVSGITGLLTYFFTGALGDDE